MPQFQTSQQFLAQGLIPRLDACFRRIETSGTLVRSHATVYAAFLSDLMENRIDASNPSVGDMLGMVGEFCDLVELEYASTH
ncbi:hypothetical protein FAZ69_08360 [Trinickia terrae]|uniref:Uncharacterized protein n=1 Tax=Trinickia terrae TaxID=2571161 RepID=A0A4U1I9G7_9BURK|nr:hypothetical protein [Trinickia terrae]TKC90151.1 hypothetical protein FAZ69_08360 [Trinickia terrae]